MHLIFVDKIVFEWVFCIIGCHMAVACVALASRSKAMASTALTEDCTCKVVERCEYDYILNVMVIYIQVVNIYYCKLKIVIVISTGVL